MSRGLSIGLSVVSFLLAGCSSLRDCAIRGMLMDHRYQQNVLPALYDSYRLKMKEGGAAFPGGGVQAPYDLDRG